jgi:hypothetical protein
MQVQTMTVTVSGTSIMKGSANCNYYLLQYNLLPQVTGNTYIHDEPSNMAVPDNNSLISKEEFDTLNSTNIPTEFGKSFMDFNEFQLKDISVQDLQRKLKALKNPSLDKIIHWSLTILLICTILVTTCVIGICNCKGKVCPTRPNAQVKAAEVNFDKSSTHET